MKVDWDPKAVKELGKLDPPIAERVRDAVDRIVAGTSVPKRLTGVGNVFSERVGDWRVILELEGDTLIVVHIGHRREVYKKL